MHSIDGCWILKRAWLFVIDYYFFEDKNFWGPVDLAFMGVHKTTVHKYSLMILPLRKAKKKTAQIPPSETKSIFTTGRESWKGRSVHVMLTSVATQKTQKTKPSALILFSQDSTCSQSILVQTCITWFQPSQWGSPDCLPNSIGSVLYMSPIRLQIRMHKHELSGYQTVGASPGRLKAELSLRRHQW